MKTICARPIRVLRVSTILRRVPLPPSAFSFLRRFAIALLAVVVLATVGFVSAQAYGRREFAKSRVIHIPDGILATVKPGEPANYLLIGSDVRPADETPQEKQAYGSSTVVGGQHSDVMMVLHVDPASHTGMLVSFPRPRRPDPGSWPQSPERGLRVRRPRTRDRNAAVGLHAAADQPLPRGRLPRLQEHRQHDRAHPPVLPDAGARSLHRPRREPVGMRERQRRSGARVRTVEALLRTQGSAEPRAVAWNYTTSTGGQGWFATGSDIDRIPRQQYFLRTVSQAAIDKSGSDPLQGRLVARRGVPESRARPDPEAERVELARAHVPRAQPGQGRDVDAPDAAFALRSSRRRSSPSSPTRVG